MEAFSDSEKNMLNKDIITSISNQNAVNAMILSSLEQDLA